MGSFGKGLAAASAEGDPEILVREQPVGFPQYLMDLFRLHGVVALVRIMQKLGGLWIDNSNLDGGGTNVHADP